VKQATYIQTKNHGCNGFSKQEKLFCDSETQYILETQKSNIFNSIRHNGVAKMKLMFQHCEPGILENIEMNKTKKGYTLTMNKNLLPKKYSCLNLPIDRLIF